MNTDNNKISVAWQALFLLWIEAESAARDLARHLSETEKDNPTGWVLSAVVKHLRRWLVSQP